MSSTPRTPDPVAEVKRLTGGVGADAVIAAVGATAAYKQGYEMLSRCRGRLLIFPAGYPKPELQVDPNELHYRKIEIIGTFGADLVDWMDSATLLSKQLIDCSYSLEGKGFAARHPEGIRSGCDAGAYRVTVDLQGVISFKKEEVRKHLFFLQAVKSAWVNVPSHRSRFKL